jgi:RNA polymerase sigma-70 factor (ECF subfamily)
VAEADRAAVDVQPGLVEFTGPAVKAALVRARANLTRRAAPTEPYRAEPASIEDLGKLRRYAELFNRRDWDSLRALMTEESRLDVVSRVRRRGPAVAEYYGRYSEIAPVEELRAEAGYFDGQAVIALFRRAPSSIPAYFVRIDWNGEHVQLIRDFRYVPYLAESGAFTPSPR